MPGWKRLLLADGPRQTINGLTLYSFYLSTKDKGDFWDLDKYTGGSYVTGALIFSTLFTCLIFIGSALLLLGAGICYIPLLCHIQGNLKVNQNFVMTYETSHEVLFIGILLPQSR